MEPLSPFEVDAAAISRLTAQAFTVAINALLRAELADQQLAGYTLLTDERTSLTVGSTRTSKLRGQPVVSLQASQLGSSRPPI